MPMIGDPNEFIRRCDNNDAKRKAKEGLGRFDSRVIVKHENEGDGSNGKGNTIINNITVNMNFTDEITKHITSDPKVLCEYIGDAIVAAKDAADKDDNLNVETHIKDKEQLTKA